ncbi:MAG: FkbM family methyltransferase [Cohaesibacteraceae bacterium]
MRDLTYSDSPDQPAIEVDASQIADSRRAFTPYAPFGTCSLGPSRSAIRAVGTKLVPRRFPRMGSILNWPIWRLSLLGRPGPVDLEPYEGFRLRLYPRENHADTKCYARPGLVDLPEAAAIARCLTGSMDQEAVVVDVGANTGTYSVLCAHLAAKAGKTARLLCIEANPKTQNRLVANLAFSGLDDQTTVARCAVSDSPGMVQLQTGTWNLGSVKVTDGAPSLYQKGLINVPARPLSSIVADAGLTRIDFLKIDIEGHEVQAIGPFLRDAPEHLFPRMVLAETKHDAGNALRKVLTDAGYTATLEGRSDTVFEQ